MTAANTITSEEQQRAEIEDALDNYIPKKTGATGVTGAEPETTGDKATPEEPGPTGVTGVLPAGFRLDDHGLWFQSDNSDNDDPRWISSPIRVTALARDNQGDAWGRLLEFHDPDDRHHAWACPMQMLASDGAEFRRTLMSMGLEIAPGKKARDRLATYVQSVRVSDRAVSTDKTGWHRGRYVMPDETIGDDDGDRVLLQVNGEPPKIAQAGTVEDWRDQIGALCSGNSRLTFAVSTAFAAPLLDIAGIEPGGVHFVGPSSIGKTAALRAAASVWGAPDYLHRWRSTANGLEAVAQAHNDGLLILDELAQVDPRQAGEAAYMLANGAGKHRARRDGLAKPAASWRLLFLSAGEINLADHMAQAGKQARAGQEVRLADVPADTGVHGAFESVTDTGAVYEDRIRQACSRYYGAAIRAYLSKLTAIDRAKLKTRIDGLIDEFQKSTLPDEADGQARRVASRFGLIAAGGELATKFGITGWSANDALESSKTCFSAWLWYRGGSGSHEHQNAIAQVRHFLEAHGDARFEDQNRPDRIIANWAGVRTHINGGMVYLVAQETFKREVCSGLDVKAVVGILKKAGYLATEEIDRYTVKRRSSRFYAIREAIHEN